MAEEIVDPEDFDDPGMSLTPEGNCREWRNAKGELHRDHDLPAVKWQDGIRCWYQHGKMHREAGAAYVQPDGYRAFFIEGEEVSFEQHREWRQNLLEERERQREERLQQIMEAAQEATVLRSTITVGRALRLQTKMAFS
jgi:hypothetical protein